MKAYNGLAGAVRYEFLMQVRRPALWIVVAVFCLSFGVVTLTPWGPLSFGLTLPQTVANWALSVQFLHPVAVGVLLADRVPRDGRTRVSELLETLPASPAGRFFGKYLGSTLATLVPLVLVYAAGLLYVLLDTADPMVVPLGVAAFLTVNLPGLLFVAAFSVSSTVVLWIPLYQFLFVGYWFWGNLVSPPFFVPTLSGTILMPIGDFMANGFFDGGAMVQGTTVLEGVASMGLLLGLAALALVCGYALWRRRTYV